MATRYSRSSKAEREPRLDENRLIIHTRHGVSSIGGGRLERVDGLGALRRRTACAHRGSHCALPRPAAARLHAVPVARRPRALNPISRCRGCARRRHCHHCRVGRVRGHRRVGRIRRSPRRLRRVRPRGTVTGTVSPITGPSTIILALCAPRPRSRNTLARATYVIHSAGIVAAIRPLRRRRARDLAGVSDWAWTRGGAHGGLPHAAVGAEGSIARGTVRCALRAPGVLAAEGAELLASATGARGEEAAELGRGARKAAERHHTECEGPHCLNSIQGTFLRCSSAQPMPALGAAGVACVACVAGVASVADAADVAGAADAAGVAALSDAATLHRRARA